MSLITIDGSFGEGGGQILRTSLTLSALTGKPFYMQNIRLKRANPGLQPQHLASVKAAAQITSASVEGAEKGSTTLKFIPQRLKAGDYRLDIQTAGSTSLVLQTITLPLSLIDRPSQVIITGGTHVPWSPCHHYLQLQWAPYMRKIGLEIELELRRAGFYPQGGGEIRAKINPAKELSSLNILERGSLKLIRGISAFANLDISVAERQKRQAEVRLKGRYLPHEISIERMPAKGKNTAMVLLAQFEHSQGCYCALGARGKRAERVADEACDALLGFLKTSGVVDEHLADQLLLPLALAKGESQFKTPRVTNHLITNVEIIKKFLPVEIEVRGEVGEEGVVRIKPLD